MNFILLFCFAVFQIYAEETSFENESTDFGWRNSLFQNVDFMNSNLKDSKIDIVIVSASSPSLAKYWEERLKKTRQHLFSDETLIITVDEDWKHGGAGNGLGTLYAYKKAREKGKKLYGVDILETQASGGVINIYHTAGQGKRLAPLTISEYGVKSGVKLPGLLYPTTLPHEKLILITLLEATIKQSKVFAPQSKGRLSVFWSDQVFIPSNEYTAFPDNHINLFIKKIPIPSQEAWEEQGLSNYGMIAKSKGGKSALFDKCSFETLHAIFQENNEIIEDLGINMGAFNLSLEMVVTLLEEFENELNEKEVLYDSDPYFWMPLTLDLNKYLSAMKSRHVSEEIITQHYQRMQKLKKNLESTKNVFGTIDIGRKSYWWDYGNLDSYFHNNIKMTKSSDEGDLMRKFYHLGDLDRDHSKILSSKMNQTKTARSLILTSDAENLEVEDSIIINSKLNSAKISHSIIYNIEEENPYPFLPYTVRADLFLPMKNLHIKLSAPLFSDGKVNWKIRQSENLYSWEEATQLISISCENLE